MAVPTDEKLSSIWATNDWRASVGPFYEKRSIYTASFNFTDLNSPVPYSIYSRQPWCQEYLAYYLTRTTTSCPTTLPHMPIISLPPILSTLEPAWLNCRQDIRGIFDPPIPLDPASVMATATDPSIRISEIASPSSSPNDPLPVHTSAPTNLDPSITMPSHGSIRRLHPTSPEQERHSNDMRTPASGLTQILSDNDNSVKTSPNFDPETGNALGVPFSSLNGFERSMALGPEGTPYSLHGGTIEGTLTHATVIVESSSSLDSGHSPMYQTFGEPYPSVAAFTQSLSNSASDRGFVSARPYSPNFFLTDPTANEPTARSPLRTASALPNAPPNAIARPDDPKSPASSTLQSQTHASEASSASYFGSGVSLLFLVVGELLIVGITGTAQII